MKTIFPYGVWPSAISAELVARASPAIDQPSFDCHPDRATHADQPIYWLQSQPENNGRNTVFCRQSDGAVNDLLPSQFSVRSRVHEYGGACYLVVGGTLYFVAAHDQRIYRHQLESDANSAPEALTPDDQGYRFADLHYDHRYRRLLCIGEQHNALDTNPEPRNFIAAIPLTAPYGVQTLVNGADFYAYPRISPDGGQLCWISWNHPAMPWDGTELGLADVNEDGTVSEPRLVAGAPEESIFQPRWSKTGVLYFVSDRSNWWNLYRIEADGSTTSICPMAAEFATPLWTLGMSTYSLMDDGSIACAFSQNGQWHLGLIDGHCGKLHIQKAPFTEITGLCSNGYALCFVGASPESGNQLVLWDFASAQIKALAPTNNESDANIDTAWYSKPQALTFATAGGHHSHAFYYPPCNPNYQGPADAKPPLIVVCHGGPTGATSSALNLKLQFWTSRGFAVLDVNYRGSTGYGRRYRNLLKGQWGVADVEDVTAGAQHLVDLGLADPERLIIRGSSAGGFTALAALTFANTFKAGASYYGIGDLEALARDTHKFESHYLEGLVGPYPEQIDLYHRRSPVHHIEHLNCPAIFFQGLEDKVVSPSQAEAMVSALKARRIKTAYVSFATEGHGFRQAENLAKAISKELNFYTELFSIQTKT